MQVAFFGNSAAASSRIIPAAAAFSARISFSFSSSSSSATSLSSFKCLRSSPLVSRLFLNQRRSPSPCFSERGLSAAATRIYVASDPDQLKSAREKFNELFRTTCYPMLLNIQLKSAREDIKELVKTKFCYPILVRLGWHDAGTYNKNIQEWPQRGGANGSLRFEIELKHGSNAGLALELLQPIKDKYSGVTYADLFQLASATAVEESGGPKIPMKYGRVDVTGPTYCPKGRLPDLHLAMGSTLPTLLAAGLPSPADHLRDVFYRMGLSDKEIVALSGAHKLGRSRPVPSGWGKPETKYTKSGPGAPGGPSWTVLGHTWTMQWWKFDNSYFKDIKERRDEDLLVLPTDAVLIEDPSFKVYAEKYAEDQETFFKDYAEAHAKLSNLGAKFDPPEGIVIG